jgi:hypothetical protein
MRLPVIVIATCLGLSQPALAQNGQGQNGQGYREASTSSMGAGLPVLAVGYGVYWLIKRRRKSKLQ